MKTNELQTETNFKFNASLMNALMNGGTIIFAKENEYNGTILIRMPKDNRIEFEEGKKYEYIEFEQHFKDSRSKADMFVSSYRNGHVREVKRIIHEEHLEQWWYFKRKNQTKNQ